MTPQMIFLLSTGWYSVHKVCLADGGWSPGSRKYGGARAITPLPGIDRRRTGLGYGSAATRRFLILIFQLVVLAFLALRGFPGARLLVHGGICLFYLAACRYPAGPITERIKMRVLTLGLLSYGAWLANTGGLCSPLLPMGLGMLLPAMLIFETSRQKLAFGAGALGVLVAVGLVSLWPAGALVAPLAPHGGHASLEFVALAAGSVLVTAAQVSMFWGYIATAYDKVAVELGTRREELCSLGEDRTRELEGAAAMLAHEMKNPLASIKCLSAHLARRCSLDDKTVERLEVVSSEADRLESIVDGFVSLSRGLGELVVSRERVFEIANGLMQLLDMRANQGGRDAGAARPPPTWKAEVERPEDPARAVLPGDERGAGFAAGAGRDHRNPGRGLAAQCAGPDPGHRSR